MNPTQWTEKYRPATWDDVVGQEQTVATLRRMASRGVLGGRALWISGAYVERCKAILAAEGLPDTLIPSKLAQDNANNLRAMIQQIEQLSYCYA